MRSLRGQRRIAIVLLALAIVGLLTAVVGLTFARHETGLASASIVSAPDSNRDALSDALSNAVGVDPYAPTAAEALPAGWLQRYHLPLDDPALPNRTAALPPAADVPAVYGGDGLPKEFRMTYGQVYAYGRPASWNESQQGPFDSHLDPTRWDTQNTSGIPYAWLIHYGLDPFDASVLDKVPRGSNVSWTPRQAYERGLDPTSPDGDRDGIPDEKEILLGTNPRAFSTTLSGVGDGWLVAHQLDPLDPALPYQDLAHRGETVLQTFRDSMRLYPNLTSPPSLGGLDPRAISTLGGPIPDVWLIRYGYDPLEANVASTVIHRETITNATGPHEYTMTLLDAYDVGKPPSWNESRNGPWWGGVDPTKNDTDGDGLSDLEELVGWDTTIEGKVKHVTSDPTKIDTDGDGLTDKQEHNGLVANLSFPPTDPRNPDTDGDGLSDGQELGVVPYRGHTLPPLDPTVADTARQGLLDGQAADYWIGRALECRTGATYAWGKAPRASVAQALFGSDDIGACSRLFPEASLRAGAPPNILNPDVDGDGLLNGWEIHPDTYAASPYAPAPGEPARSASDPANNDTDGDGLPDGWEVRYGVPLASGNGWNLDPAKWSSMDDGTSDADEDPTNDTTTWFSYQTGASSVAPTAHVFVRTNMESYQAGADPNRRSSSPDGISDAWKIFWGAKYFALPPAELGSVYPGSPGSLRVPADRPVPEVGRDDSHLVSTTVVRRYLVDDATNESVPSCAQHKVSVTSAQGARLSLCVVTFQVPYDYAAIAENHTNPYLDDTNGDGIPDAWECTWSWLGQDQRAPVSPVKANPTLGVAFKGISLADDVRLGTDPYVQDSDLGGVSDAQEAKLGLDPMDPTDDVQGANAHLDSDGDGLTNVQESGGFLDARGDLVKTSPIDPDTDHDGLLDGRSLHNVVGHKLMLNDPSDAALLSALEARGLLVTPSPDGSADVLGEQDAGTDPTKLSTAGDGVPDGWDVLYGAKIPDPTSRFQHYAFGRPAWWNESLDGVWRWGLLPDEVATDDHDHDGLSDTNGEDPIPYANPLNVLPHGDPLEPGINASERLLRSQAYGAGFRDVTSPLAGQGSAHLRASTVLTLDPLPATLRGDGTQGFSGRLTTARGEPVRNATILLSLGSPDFVMGVAITNDSGGFTGTIQLSTSVGAPPDSAGVPVFGRLDGNGAHENPLALAPSYGSTEAVFAWAYNESWNALPRQTYSYLLDDGSARVHGILGTFSAAQNLTILTPTALALDVPAHGHVQDVVDANVTLTDAFGRGVPGATIRVQPGNLTLTTDADGAASYELTLPREPGRVATQASFAGSDLLLASNATGTVSISQPTSLSAIGPSVAVAPGKPFAISGALVTQSGQPVAGANVTVDLGGSAFVNATDASGAFRVVAAVPQDAAAPTVDAALSYGGNDSFDPARVHLDVAVDLRPHWVVRPVEVEAGAPGPIVATLVAAGGSPLGGIASKVTTTWGARIDTPTAPDGTLNVTLDTSSVAPGEWLYTVSETSADDGPATSTSTILVRTPTVLAVTQERTVLGAPAAVHGTLRDVMGRPVGGQPVVVSLGPSARKVVTGGDGAFDASFVLPANASVGPIHIDAAFPGTADATYEPSEASVDARVLNGVVVTLAGSDISTMRPVVAGTVSTLTGSALPNVELVLDLHGERTTALSDGSGSFVASFDRVDDLPVGPCALVVAADGGTDAEPTTVTFTMIAKAPATLVTTGPNAFLIGTSETFPASIVGADGASVDDATLRATLDGAPLGLEARDGAIALRVPPGLPAGSHQLVIAGSSPTHVMAPWSEEVRAQLPSTIGLAPRPTLVAGRGAFVPVVVTSGGQPVANASLAVTIGGGSPVQVWTGADGAAQVPIPPELADTPIQVAFAGDATHGAVATFGTTLVQPVPAPLAWWWLLLASLFVGMVGVAWWLLRRRRSQAAVASLMQKVARDLRAGKADLRILYTIYLELLQFAGLTEATAETMTFRDVLIVLLRDPRIETDAAVVNEAFNAVLYGRGLADEDWSKAASAFERLSVELRARASLPTSEG